MSQTSVSPPTKRAAGLAEKASLGFIGGAAAAIGIVSLVFLVLRIVELATGAETTLSNAVLIDPLTLVSRRPQSSRRRSTP